MPRIVTSYEPAEARRSVVTLQYHYGLTAVAMKGGAYVRVPHDQIDAEMRKNRNLFVRQLCGFTIPRDSTPEWFAEALLRAPGVQIVTCRHPRDDGSIHYVDHIYLGTQIAFAPIVADRVVGDSFSSADARNRAENLRRGAWSHIRVDENGKRRTSLTIMVHLVGVVVDERIVPFEYDAAPAPMYIGSDNEGGTLLRYAARTYQTDLLIHAINAAAQLAGSAAVLLEAVRGELGDEECDDQKMRSCFPFAYAIVTGGQKSQQLTGNNEITLWTPALATKRGMRVIDPDAMQKMSARVKSALNDPKTAKALLEDLAAARHGNDNLTLLLADDEVFDEAIAPLVASASAAETHEGDEAAEEKENGSSGEPLF